MTAETVPVCQPRRLDVPLAVVQAHAPGWATSTRTTLTEMEPGVLVITFESEPVEIVIGGMDGTSSRPVLVSVVVDDYYDAAGPVVVRSRVGMVRVGGDLLAIAQARRFAVEVLAAVNDAADAAGVL